MSQRLRDTLQKAAKTQTESSAPPQIKGSLEVRSLIDILKFCETNSLNGKVVVKKDGEEGTFVYEKGELQNVELGDIKDDEALDTMIGWTSGEFFIQPELVGTELGEVAKADSDTPTIVLVNSSMVVQKVVQKAFESMGYEVYATDNIQKGVNLTNKMNPTMVIADIKFQGGDAETLVKSIREVYPGYIILLTDNKTKGKYANLAELDHHLQLTNNIEIGEVVKIAENIVKK